MQQESKRFTSFFDASSRSASPPPPTQPVELDSELDSELDAHQGRFVCLCLITVMADAGCVPAAILQSDLLPVVAELAKNEASNLRRQCVEALSAMSTYLPADVVIEQVVRASLLPPELAS